MMIANIARRKREVFFDYSSSNRAVTRVGAPSQVTDSPFTTPGSGVFSGSSQYLTIPKTTDLQFTSGSTFCVECWVKTTQSLASGGFVFFSTYRSGSPYSGYGIGMGNSYAGDRRACFWDGSVWRAGGSISINDGAWHHVAMQSISGAAKLYVDGVLAVSWTMPSSVAEGNSRTTYSIAFDGISNYYAGNIAGMRVSNTSRYTAAFTPTIDMLTDDSSTLFLLNFGNY